MKIILLLIEIHNTQDSTNLIKASEMDNLQGQNTDIISRKWMLITNPSSEAILIYNLNKTSWIQIWILNKDQGLRKIGIISTKPVMRIWPLWIELGWTISWSKSLLLLRSTRRILLRLDSQGLWLESIQDRMVKNKQPHQR